MFIAFLPLAIPQTDRETDSLQTVLKSSTDLKQQINVYALLSKKYHTIDLQMAKYYANQALVLSRNASIDSYTGTIYRSLGDIAIKEDSLDLAKQFYEDAYSKFLNQQEPENLADILIVLGNVEFVRNQYASALDYYLKGVEISRDNNFIRRQARLYINLGALNINLEKYSEAVENLSKALEICIDQKDSLELPNIYLNMGLSYQSLNDTSLAQFYFQKSLVMYQKLDHTDGVARSYMSLAEIEKAKGNISRSFELLNDALDLLKRPNQYYSAPGAVLITNCYLIKGENYLLLNQIDSAYENFQQAFVKGYELKQLSAIVTASSNLSAIWRQKGNSDSALYYFTIFHNYSDSLTNIENIRELTYLESQYKFEQKINQEKEIRISQVNHEKRKYLAFLFISLGLMFAIIILFLLLYFLRKKARQSEIKHTKLKEELKERNKELTSHVMYQLKKNEFILDISKKLQKEISKFKPEDRGIIEKIISDMERDSNDNAWEEFEIRFHGVHSDFNKKLLEKFPDLSTNDLRLCAFIRLNLNTKEISAITYQSTSSIDTARFRLKQKLGLIKEDNLMAFLSQF